MKKKRLNKPASCLEISFFRRIKILFRILNGPLFADVERRYDAGYFLTVYRVG